MRDDRTLSFDLFRTRLGWLGIAGCSEDDEILRLVVIGHPHRDAARQALAEQLHLPPESVRAARWNDALRTRLCDYAEGRPDPFDDVRIDPPRATLFQRRVVDVVRGIPFGRRMTYGEVAAAAGSPGAARAVGQVMAGNPVPLVVPCHRVVGHGGSLGGFTSPQGVALKQRLLDLESAARLS